jgi:hypothetical protein
MNREDKDFGGEMNASNAKWGITYIAEVDLVNRGKKKIPRPVRLVKIAGSSTGCFPGLELNVTKYRGGELLNRRDADSGRRLTTAKSTKHPGLARWPCPGTKRICTVKLTNPRSADLHRGPEVWKISCVDCSCQSEARTAQKQKESPREHSLYLGPMVVVCS